MGTGKTMSLLSVTTVRELIGQGENSAVEFKSGDVHADSIAKELVAFANTLGGTLLFGVDDNGVVVGFEENLKHEERIANIVRNNLIPPLYIESQWVELPEGKILVVVVPKGKERPYQTNKHQFLIRIGSTNRVATQGELMRLFQQAGMFHFDATSVEKARLETLNSAKLEQYFSQYNMDYTAEENKCQLLSNADIMDENHFVTLAGLLIFGIYPQKYLPFLSISFVHFAGNTIVDELIDKQVVEGTLDIQVDTALAILRNNLKAPSKISGAKRVDLIYQYPEKVFRELLVNAVVHRNYSISGSRIRIQLFQDRLEFISPGRLPNTVTIEKLTTGVSYSVNPVLLKFMENQRYMDKLGRGLPMVYQEAVRNGLKVKFEEIGEEFKVTLELATASVNVF